MRSHLISALLLGLCLFNSAAADQTFDKVTKLFQDRCLDCHSAPDPDAGFLMENYAALIKGGESGPAIIPGKSDESLLVKMVEGTIEKDGKKILMPPGKREKLSSSEIALIRTWIDAGAKAPDPGAILTKEVVTPKITPTKTPKRSVFSLASEPKTKLLAIGRMAEVEIYSAESQSLVRKLTAFEGPVNSLAFSPDGKMVIGAGGTAGMKGEIRVWNTADGFLIRARSGHSDSIYSVAIAPDGKLFATGSYDQKIKLWNFEAGTELSTLSGHNGCVYSLSFRPDGKILASASGDRTVKLWDVQSGARRDTLSQPLKEQYAVAFTPDGKQLAAGGVDNRIRVWEISDDARETTNPLLHSKFAHEGAILQLTFSSDGKSLVSSAEDRTLKLWDTGTLRERRSFEEQPDWASALAFILDNKGLAVGRFDGSLAFYRADDGSALLPPKPELARAEPRGFQRGTEVNLKLFGKHLQRVESIKLSDSRLSAELAKPGASGELHIRLKSGPAVPRGAYELSAVSPSGESAPLKVYLDDLPQFLEQDSPEAQRITATPITLWGTHERPGDKDSFKFQAEPDQTYIFDAAAKSIGSKADLVLSVIDSSGKVLESNHRFDKTGDPLIAYTFDKPGEYELVVSELVIAGSADHYYRVSIGTFPLVTAIYPPVVHKNEDRANRLLIGINLPARKHHQITPEDGAEVPVGLDPEKFRWRGDLKAPVVDLPIYEETEPSDSLSKATVVPIPAIAAGRLGPGEKEDWFRFQAKAGQHLILQTAADQLGSPMDSKLEIRDSDGKPVGRALLQAVRASAVTFRGIDSNTIDCRVENWEEMELNQLLFMQGEVVRLFRAPQGPDSGFNFYALNGKRRNYFDTTATAHGNAEPCYIVEPHPVDARVAPNGLPTFPIFFENDDDADRKLGTDSKVHFIAPREGNYFARVTDTRGFSGNRFLYTLSIREARPDFRVSIDGMNPTVAKGSGQRFAVNAERIDGFEGEIKVEVSGLPPGFIVSNPIAIQEGHTTAFGTLFVGPDASTTTTGTAKFTAGAQINGEIVTHDGGTLGKITVTESSPLYVELEPSGSGPREMVIAPGGSVPAFIKTRRNGHNELVTFQVENLPHGIIVDNIGLNGVLIPKDQNEREIFFTAAKWVPDTDRLCYAVSNEAGRQTSRPLLLKVRKNSGRVAAR